MFARFSIISNDPTTRSSRSGDAATGTHLHSPRRCCPFTHCPTTAPSLTPSLTFYTHRSRVGRGVRVREWRMCVCGGGGVCGGVPLDSHKQFTLYRSRALSTQGPAFNWPQAIRPRVPPTADACSNRPASAFSPPCQIPAPKQGKDCESYAKFLGAFVLHPNKFPARDLKST